MNLASWRLALAQEDDKAVCDRPPHALRREVAAERVDEALTRDFGANAMMAAVLGMVTGIGGGMMRDVLLREVPTVLRSEIYAIAALAGAAVVVAGHLFRLPAGISMFVGAALCFGIRMVAIRRSWQLPSPTVRER